MKLTDIKPISESVQNMWAIELEDGGGFNVSADSGSEARKFAKTSLRPGQRIVSVKADTGLQKNFEDRKAKLITYVTNHVLLKRTPSLQKTYIRQLKAATTGAKINAIDARIQSELKPQKVTEAEKKYESKFDTDGKVKFDHEIHVSHVNPPIPHRHLDWCATLDSYDGAPDSNHPIGHGADASAALIDLMHQVENSDMFQQYSIASISRAFQKAKSEATK